VCHILVVDDHHNLRQALELVLEGEGYRVTTAANGHQALEVVAADPPDVLLTDLRMPGLSGTELCDYLLAQGSTVPVIFMSQDPAGAALTTAHRADAYLVKPFAPASLLAALARLACYPGG
jgi:CheY-like chemotaxis protein